MKTKYVIYTTILLLFQGTAFGQVKVNEEDLQTIVMFDERGQTDNALTMIDSIKKEVTVKDENYAMLIMARAKVNMDLFNYEQAIKDCEEALELNLIPEAEQDLLHMIGRHKKYIGDFEGAILAYKKIVELDPADFIIYNNLASTYNSAKKYREAITTLNLNPNPERLPMEDYHYAIAYFNLDKLDSAQLHIDIFLKTSKGLNDYLAHKIAAQIYFALDDKEKSCELISKAVNILVSEEDKIALQPLKLQQYYLVKEVLKEIEETRNLKPQICD